jgi:hypothetical protein
MTPLLYFLAGLMVDGLLIVYYKAIVKPDRLLGAILSGIITFINVFVLINLIKYDSGVNMGAYILGNIVATYCLIGRNHARD